jgi:hypothetical protein
VSIRGTLNIVACDDVRIRPNSCGKGFGKRSKDIFLSCSK